MTGGVTDPVEAPTPRQEAVKAPAAPRQPSRFRRSVVRDLRNRLRFSLVGLVVLIGLHVAAMMALEGLRIGDAIWLTFTTITTTGYGDYAAKSAAGRAATIVLIYLSGIFLVSQAASAFFELRVLRRERQRRGEWRWDMRDHIVFINAPDEDAGDYMRRLLDQLHRSRARLAGTPAIVLSEAFPNGLPPALEDDPMIVQVRGRFDDPAALEAAGVDEARMVVILAERDSDRISDSQAFDLVHRLRDERGFRGRIIAECIDEHNRPRLLKAGASTVVRALRGYPEMIVRAVVAPGSEQIVEQLFVSSGDECLRFEVRIEGLPWARIARHVMEADFGTALGYADPDGRVHTNPRPTDTVHARALYIVVDEGAQASREAIQAAFDRLAAAGEPTR